MANGPVLLSMLLLLARATCPPITTGIKEEEEEVGRHMMKDRQADRQSERQSLHLSVNKTAAT